MQRIHVFRDVDGAVKKAALLEATGRGVDLLGMQDGEFRQDGIAMMAVGVERISPMGRIAPHRIGKVFVLRAKGPMMISFGPGGARTNHLLQEDDIGVNRADRFAEAVQGNPAVAQERPL
jgi:hypothetical protein